MKIQQYIHERENKILVGECGMFFDSVTAQRNKYILLMLVLGSCAGQRSTVPVQYTAIFWDHGAR